MYRVGAPFIGWMVTLYVSCDKGVAMMGMFQNWPAVDKII